MQKRNLRYNCHKSFGRDGFKAGPPSFDHKVEVLNSYTKALIKQTCEPLFFVTVQPTEQLGNEVQCHEYADRILPISLPAVIIPEYNTVTTIRKRSKVYELSSTLHVHLLVPESVLEQLPECVLYQSRTELERLKHESGLKSFHIVAREVFNEDLSCYLSKQAWDNPIMPKFRKAAGSLDKCENMDDNLNPTISNFYQFSQPARPQIISGLCCKAGPATVPKISKIEGLISGLINIVLHCIRTFLWGHQDFTGIEVVYFAKPPPTTTK